MKVTDIRSSSRRPTVSFELFLARSQKAAENPGKSIAVLVAQKPDFVSVTFGSGGSTREGSPKLVEKLKSEKGKEINHETEIRLV